MLFVYALVPWMRKYRKSEDNIGTDFNFAAHRMWTGRMPPESSTTQANNRIKFESMQNEEDSSKSGSSEAVAEVVDCPRDNKSETSIESLQQQNEQLKRENELIRHLLYHQEGGKKKSNLSNSCPPS